jgi:hypothetical protein
MTDAEANWEQMYRNERGAHQLSGRRLLDLTRRLAELERSYADVCKNERKLDLDVRELERLVRGAQSRVRELRAALCLVLADIEGEWGHDTTLGGDGYAGPQSGRAARATLGLGCSDEIPEEWYIPDDARPA